MKFLRPLFFLLFSASCLASAAMPDELFRQANEDYSKENYQAAVALYEQCLPQAQSAALHYNLANAYFKLGRTGPAVLHYEKALALQPSQAEARANLAFVRREAGLPAPADSVLERFAAQLPVGVWCWFGSTALWGALAMWLLPPLFHGANAITRLGLVLCLAAALLAGAAVAGHVAQSGEIVVLGDDTPLRVAPAPESPAAARLQGGQTATIKKTADGFYFLATPDGKSGWVKSSEAGQIWD